MLEFLHLICDYAPGDLAWAEVLSALSVNLDPAIRIHQTSVKSFDTIATGFVLAQLALSSEQLRPKKLLLFANTAPRKDKKEAKTNNEGEGLLYVKLKNGIPILVVNSGYSLAFLTNEIEELYSTNAKEEGSQFRSRDFFPQVVHQAINEDYSFLLHKLDPAVCIPPPPKRVVAYIDSFGNIKTTIRSNDDAISKVAAGTRLKIKIGNIVRTATVATGIFNVMEGDLAFAPGSSGHNNRFWELFTRGGSAWDQFGHPLNGTEITIEGHD
jgi:S-adenosyl-l-methionine hydroxide adenosyltransferase